MKYHIYKSRTKALPNDGPSQISMELNTRWESTGVQETLSANKCITPTQSQHKWLRNLTVNETDKYMPIKWQEAYQLAYKYTKATKLMDFQFKFLHRRIRTKGWVS